MAETEGKFHILGTEHHQRLVGTIISTFVVFIMQCEILSTTDFDFIHFYPTILAENWVK